MSTARVEQWVPTETFGTRLAMIRHQLRLNQKQAAMKCGIPEDSWSNWERGVSEPRRLGEVARKIHDATGVDIAWLVWGTTAPPPPAPIADDHDDLAEQPFAQSRCIVRPLRPILVDPVDLPDAAGF